MTTKQENSEYTETEVPSDVFSSEHADEQETAFIIDADTQKKRYRVPVGPQLILLGAILLLLLGGTLTPKIVAFFGSPADATTNTFDPEITSQEQEAVDDSSVIKPFSAVRISGEAAYVWDIQTQRVLYKKEPSKQLPLASLTKLMTALVAQEILSETAEIAIGGQAIRQDGDSGLLEGETFARLTLSDLVLMSSSNDGAYALAAAAGGILQPSNGANAFVNAMNIRADELNLHETYFKNPTGLDISENEGGAYGSAKDMAFLMEHILIHQPDILPYTTEGQSRIYSEDGVYHDAINTNYYIDEIPGLIGSKTGYTELAGGNLIVAFDAGLNRPIVVAVLGSTQHERFTDVVTLVKEAQKYVAQE